MQRKTERKTRTILYRAATLIGSIPVGHATAQQAAPATQFMDSMSKSMAHMDHAMNAAPMNGNVDHDFAAMMLPHHLGAIEMAKTELLYGKDPVMRRLAQEILVDQQSEIDAMNLWLSKQPQQQYTKDTK